MLGRVKLDNTLLTCDKSKFNQITAQSRNRTLVTVVRDTCVITVPPAPMTSQFGALFFGTVSQLPFLLALPMSLLHTENNF